MIGDIIRNIGDAKRQENMAINQDKKWVMEAHEQMT